MHTLPLLAAAVAGAVQAQKLPYWTAPLGNWSLPLGGWPVVPNATWTNVFNSTPALCSYNHAAMVTYGAEAGDAPMFLVTWKNNCVGEDKPGQRILFSQSSDGVQWTPVTVPGAIFFPNMSTNSNPAALFAEPPLWLNGRLYAAASPKQFCLYPDQYQDILLLRRVYTNQTGLLGPAFWAASTPPPAFAEASAINSIFNLTQMDAQTQGDVALLTPTATVMPCAVPGNPTTKCEACSGGSQLWSSVANVSNERAHYTLPGGEDYNDVLLYRAGDPVLHASVRSTPGQGSWSAPVPTNIPNDWSNLNAGVLPDGRRYLISNTLPPVTRDPVAGRDPLTIATSVDGYNWNTCAVAMSCFLMPGGQQCGARSRLLERGEGEDVPGLQGRTNGCSYPQGIVVEPLGALFVVATNNKEDVWIARLPLESL